MDVTSDIFLTKLRRLRAQLNVAKYAEYSYPDAIEALNLLLRRTESQIARIKDSAEFPPSLRDAILRDANFLVTRVTYIAGIIIRSASVRNAFEVFDPFLDLCKAVTGENAKLILSSEWQYIPFTYPQNIQELPDFIFIGLPASESDNALVFPCAGHELGHSVWQKHKLQREFNSTIRSYITEEFRRNRPQFDAAYPDLKDADPEQDMFVQFIKSQVFNFVSRQAEEFFSDFVGLCLFGESYLYSFQYLIAPRLSGKRSLEYPDTLTRVQVLESLARDELDIRTSDYAASFSSDDPATDAHARFVTASADAVVGEIVPRLFQHARAILQSAKIAMPTAARTEAAEKSFIRGVPFESDASLGDFINAAWRVYRGSDHRTEQMSGAPVIENLSDLVFKSIETYELRKFDA